VIHLCNQFVLGEILPKWDIGVEVLLANEPVFTHEWVGVATGASTDACHEEASHKHQWY
jgi:hypothetical protein